MITHGRGLVDQFNMAYLCVVMHGRGLAGLPVCDDARALADWPAADCCSDVRRRRWRRVDWARAAGASPASLAVAAAVAPPRWRHHTTASATHDTNKL